LKKKINVYICMLHKYANKKPYIAQEKWNLLIFCWILACLLLN